MRALLLAWMLVQVSVAPALESRDARGLDVVVERMTGPVIVDGLKLHIQRAQGRDVPELAHRVEQRWRVEGGELRYLHKDGWQMLSRWQAGRSELIQWRGEGGSAQLLSSVLDTLQRIARPAAPPFRLPPQCQWGRVIEGEVLGRQYSQRSAHCSLESGDLLARLDATLQSGGWVIRARTAASLELAHAAGQARLLLVPGGADHSTALVWIGTRTSGGDSR